MRSSFLIVIVMTLTLFLPMAAMPNGAGPAQGSGDGPEPVRIDLYMNNSATGSLIPVTVGHENVEARDMAGNPALPFVVGRWATADLKIPLSIYGSFSCTLWVESMDSAKNAWFEVEVYRDSTLLAEFNSTRQDLSPTPTKIVISDMLNAELRAGESLDVQVYYYADLIIVPNKILPQAARASLLYGGGQYTSGISIITTPLTIEILEPEIEPNVDYISFRATVKEAFDSDPGRMHPVLTVTPPPKGEFKTYSNATGTKTAEGVLFNVDWEYVEDKAKDGKYTVTLELSYDGNLTFSNTTSFELDVPEKAVTDISQTPIKPFIIIGVFVLVGVLVFFAYKKGLFKKRKTRPKGKKTKTKAKARPKGRSKPAKKEKVIEAEEVDDD
jgi:hypothetical protein